MIMGHISFCKMGFGFDKWIHAFHMPMFFFISGFLYKNNSLGIKKFFVKKFRSLIVPYISFGLIHFIVSVFMYGYDVNYLKHLLFINTDGLPIAGALWFLTALFFVDIIYYLIDRFVKKDYYQFIVVILVFACALLFKAKIGVLPFALGSSSAGLVLFFIGNKLKDKITNINWFFLLILTFSNVFLVFTNGYVNMRTEVYSNTFLFYLNSVCSSIVLINYAIILEKILKNNCISKFFQNIGRNSIVFVCLNQLVILLINRFFAFDIPFKNYVILFLSIFVLYICSFIISNTRLKILIVK